MIKDALKEITIISDDEIDNTDNYLEALNYLDNVYLLITTLQPNLSINDYRFLPSFKGQNVVERLGILSTTEENELKYFRIKSSLFSDKQKVLKIENDCHDICSRVDCSGDIMEFFLY